MDHSKYIGELENNRLRRLKQFYENLSQYNEFSDFYYEQFLYKVPKEIPYDKNISYHYLRYPMNFGSRQLYIVTCYHKYYQLYRSDNHFYFIDTINQYPSKEYAFGTSVMYSYIAMSIYELLQWLTSKRCVGGPINVIDEVFTPIFEIPKYNNPLSEYSLKLTMYPSDTESDKQINISIFN